MKKTLFFAAAALALASCSQDEVLEVNRGEAISFRTVVNGNTRAADVDASNLASFEVTAMQTTTTTAYFSEVTFTGSGTPMTYNSENPYYWPSTTGLDFYAWAPLSNSQIEKTNYKTFVVTPDATANSNTQVDLVYANTNGKTKAANSAGVALNFRHAESKIAVQVKNTNENLDFAITDWKIVFVSKTGTFTYSDTNTDTKNSAQLSSSSWSSLGTASVDNYYQQACTKSVSANTTTAADLSNNLILIPQTQTAASAYAAATVGAKLNGSYIAIKAKITNPTDDTVIYDDGEGNSAWMIWPITISWTPGKKYTYIVDLAGGGYKETNDGATETSPKTDTDLDPVLDGAIIKFVSVTVDDWSDASSIDVYNND